MIVVDSSVWIDYFNGKVTPKTDWLDAALGNQSIFTGDLILTELLQGFQSDKDFKKAKSLLLNFPVVGMLGQEVALQSASNYRYLRKKGVAIRKMIDITIGTFCIHNAFSLLHDDLDFTPLQKHLHLRVVQI